MTGQIISHVNTIYTDVMFSFLCGIIQTVCIWKVVEFWLH